MEGDHLEESTESYDIGTDMEATKKEKIESIINDLKNAEP